MMLDQLVGNSETKPGTFADSLGCKEWFHDASHCVCADPRAIVSHDKCNALLLRHDSQLYISAGLTGVAGIEQQIDQDLLHQPRLTTDFWKLRIGRARQMHACLREPMFDQVQCYFPKGRGIDVRQLR